VSVHADTSPLFYLDWGRAALVNRIIRLQKVLNEQQRAVDWLHKELHEQQQAAYSKGLDEAMKEARHGL
jgi:hypothetical protein